MYNICMSEVLPQQFKHHKGFLDLFPTPKFLFISSVGVALSDLAIQVMEFKNKGQNRHLSIKHAISVPLPAGAVVAGYVHDIPGLTNALTELHVRYGFEYFRATLPEEKAYVFTTEIDKEPFDSLRDRVAFTIEENVPTTLAKSVFDFEIIGKIKGKETIKVAVTVLPLKVVEMYLGIFDAAGLTPISFSIESQAIARAVVPRHDTRTYLIINLQEEKAGLYIVEDKVVQFTSTPGFGTRRDQNDYLDIQNLKTEIRKVFGFWNTRLDSRGIPERKIERVIFTGVGANQEEFILKLMNDVDVDYAVANVWENAFDIEQNLPEVSFNDSLSFAAAVGVALPTKEPVYV